MHEASIVERVLCMAAERVPQQAILRRVHVRVGALTGVSPDSMRFYFEALGPASAVLDVQVEPLRATCTDCGQQWRLSAPEWCCRGCSGTALSFENGLELELVAIEVEDAGDDPYRREDPRPERRSGG